MKKSGSAWKANGKSGPYLSLQIDLGVLGSVKALMFPNTKKTSPEQPDYNIVIADGEVKAAAPRQAPPPQPAQANQSYKKPVITPRSQPIPSDNPPEDLWDQSDVGGPEFL